MMWCDAYCGDACEIKECKTKRAVCLHRTSNTFTKEEARTRLVAGEVHFAHKFSTDGVGTGEEIRCNFVSKLAPSTSEETIQQTEFIYKMQETNAWMLSVLLMPQRRLDSA